MKKTVRSFVVLVVFAMALTGLSLAQDNAYRVTANIPFDFYAGDQQLPAGTYQFNVNYSDRAVTLRNYATGRCSVLLARPGDAERSGTPVVEFDVVAGSYMLSDVKTAGDGVSFPERRSLLASAKRSATVSIAAALR